MENIWRELRTLRTSSSRIASALSGSLSKIVLRKVNRIASGQLNLIGPDYSVSSVYAISVESLSVGSDIGNPLEQQSDSIGLIRKIILDHDGDILDSSPDRVMACWAPSEQSNHSVVARLAIQAALKVCATVGDRFVSCVCYGELNHAIVGGVCNQFVPFIFGQVLQTLNSGNTLARSQGSQFVFSNVILNMNSDLSSSLTNIAPISQEFSSCSIPSDTLLKVPLDAQSARVQQDLTCASHQWILSCIPHFSPDRKEIQWKFPNFGSDVVSICVRIEFETFLRPKDSETPQNLAESFTRMQAAVASLQRRCFAVNGELWRIAVHDTEIHVFIACWLIDQGNFASIEGMISCIFHDLNAMQIQFSIGIDSKAANIVTFGPDTRSTFFIASECVRNSETTAVSCPWYHIQTNCIECFPTSAHSTLCNLGSDVPNVFKHVQKIHTIQQGTIFFERQEAMSEFQLFLEHIRDDPHQGALAICGCFGSGKSNVLNSMQFASGVKGIMSLRCCPESRNSPPLAPFISILSQLLGIDMLSATKEYKLQKCRSYVRTQMLADDRDVALLGVILDFTLENDFLEGLTVSGILEELKSVMSRAFHALGSSSSPFILFIENIHLLDSFSWDLLMDLVSKKVNIVCEALDAYDSDIFALEMKEFLRHTGVTKFPLNTVSLEVFEAFLCQKFKCTRVKPEVVSYLRTQSGGRNLFANEWSDYMMINQSVSVDDGELKFSGDYCLSVNPIVPSSVQCLIEADFCRLQETQQLFLKIVAILGRCFTLEDVCFLSRKQSSKPFASSKKTSVQEAQATYELCSRLCELGFLRPDVEFQELFTVTYVAPSLLTAAGSAFNPVLHTQKAAGLEGDSVIFWCFQSHVVQNIILGMLRDDQKKAISLKVASQCQFTSKALTHQAQESAKSSFRIARHLFDGGNSIDSLSVIHTLSATSIYSFIRENVFLCFPPPALFEVNETAYIASRMFLVPWIREFCRSVESTNPFKVRSCSASPLRSTANRPPSSKSSSPSKISADGIFQVIVCRAHFRFILIEMFQDHELKLKAELSSISIKSSSNKLQRLTDPPKRLARCGGVMNKRPLLIAVLNSY